MRHHLARCASYKSKLAVEVSKRFENRNLQKEQKIMRKLMGLLVVVAMALPLAGVAAAPKANKASSSLPKVDLVMWHQEGADVMTTLGIQKIFDDWAAKNAPRSTLKLLPKNTEALP